MTHYWYATVCDGCEEAVMTHVNGSTEVYLDGPEADWQVLKDYPKCGVVGPYTEADVRRQWFDSHYGCDLRMVWRDDQWDALYKAGWGWARKVPQLWLGPTHPRRGEAFDPVTAHEPAT